VNAIIYLQAARNLAVEPARCTVVEDSQSGIQAAYAAGIGQIIALGPTAAHQGLAQLAGVSAVIENLQQFPQVRQRSTHQGLAII
jgi:beta-phosphoglucomutase-like phosphatase (HAD superfamily)